MGYLGFKANTAGSWLTLTKEGSNDIWSGSYSYDEINWESYSLDTLIRLNNIGDTVYFKGSFTSSLSTSSHLYFEMGGSISAFGNIMSLSDGDDYETAYVISRGYQFFSLFMYCTALTTPPQLPATIVNIGCYWNMFEMCTNLLTLPELPATSLGTRSYCEMFRGCTKIKLSTTQTGDYTIPFRIPTSGTGSIDSYSLNNMFSETGGTFKSTPSINTTYYLELTPKKIKLKDKNNISLYPQTKVENLIDITATAAELNTLDGITATTAELNILDGITATTQELNYTDGVTSNIQIQINGKESSSNKVTSITSSSTNTQYPSAKCVYDLVGNVESLLEAL